MAKIYGRGDNTHDKKYTSGRILPMAKYIRLGGECIWRRKIGRKMTIYGENYTPEGVNTPKCKMIGRKLNFPK